MSDFFEPYEKLIRIVILGKRFEVPENNLLLRQMQYVSEDIGYGRYCWNGECRLCEVQYRRAPGETEQSALACRVKGQAGMRLTKLAFEMKYNMSDALRNAESDEEALPGP
jgi:2Fe-2S iron-sulfur cluster binding domain